MSHTPNCSWSYYFGNEGNSTTGACENKSKEKKAKVTHPAPLIVSNRLVSWTDQLLGRQVQHGTEEDSAWPGDGQPVALVYGFNPETFSPMCLHEIQRRRHFLGNSLQVLLVWILLFPFTLSAKLIWVHMQVRWGCSCVYGGQWSMLGIFLDCSPLYWGRALHNLEFTCLARLAARWAPGTFVCWNYGHVPLCLAFYTSARDLNSGPHSCKTSILPPHLSV